jgi:hypothetical protein
MTDAPKGKRGPKTPNLPTPAHCKALWLTANKPSLRELEKLLRAQGYEIDDGTLSRWSTKDAEWHAAMVNTRAKISPTKLMQSIINAKDDGQTLAPEVILGVKAQLVARLYETIKCMQIDTIDEWMKALDCCDRIEALIHAERGKAIADVDRLAVPRGVTPSLVARLNPSVAVPPFKKPAANGNGGGH